MGRRRSLGSTLKRRATNSAKQTAYMIMWGEEPPKSKKKTGGKKKNT